MLNTKENINGTSETNNNNFTKTESDPNRTADYGYLFSTNAPTLGGFHRGGLLGQYCIVLSEYDLVFTTTQPIKKPL